MSLIKTKQDNDVIYRTGLVYAKNNTDLSGPIDLGDIYDETKQNNNVIHRISLVYVENDTE